MKKLSGKDLAKLIEEAAKELAQRKRLEVLKKDIQAMLSKHKVKRSELPNLIQAILSETKGRKSTKVRSRSKVVPKFKNPNGSDAWSGRGRAPRWVSQICEANGLTVDEFKLSPAYRIDTASQTMQIP
ncbi:MAG: H-NS family nucleoid-associated regulatory protein [Candidatus Azotimanducaceae bacterium WSBS_2022_MAG_OTU7]